ncbi:FAD-linked sulfhydryl oxidase ERV1, putative [Plasmodium relictum]|uniref:Sulfhydryl oxidase n=1 Tax=Plasmodium relictum TaxID=85471 RepID=A0A1J1HCA4_PLARL|nr:FAD-linked sulfhydryl oxidase ERV1, putative [Plasmodium relictum]CRH03043.1 FAD-linked sulfhydryl oxidase ERV1, putative [Plasmodium relictum]
MDIEKCYENSCKDREKIKFFENKNTKKTIYPPDRAEIGRASWLILHTISANYPDKPTEEEKLKHTKFFYAFSNLYPCHICKLDLLHLLKKYQLNCENKVSYSTFIFNLHNMINEEIGKDIYPCDNIQNIIDKYKTKN